MQRKGLGGRPGTMICPRHNAACYKPGNLEGLAVKILWLDGPLLRPLHLHVVHPALGKLLDSAIQSEAAQVPAGLGLRLRSVPQCTGRSQPAACAAGSWTPTPSGR